MKKENKTLKDLGLRGKEREPKLGHWYVDGDELKAETIKWVKWKLGSSDLKIEKMVWEDNKLRINWKGTDRFSAGFIQGIAELHNITEEDLI